MVNSDPETLSGGEMLSMAASASLPEELNAYYRQESLPCTSNSVFGTPTRKIEKELSLREQLALRRGSTRDVEVLQKVDPTKSRKEIQIKSSFANSNQKLQCLKVEAHSSLPKEKSSRNRLLRAYRYREMYLLPRFVSQENGLKRKLEPGEFHPNSQLYPLLTPLKDLSEFGTVGWLSAL